MSSEPHDIGSILSSHQKVSPQKVSPQKGASSPQKVGVSSPQQSEKKSVNRRLFDDGHVSPQQYHKGKENKEPNSLIGASNKKDIEQRIPKTFLAPKSRFSPYLFGNVQNVGEGEDFIPNRFMAKVKRNEKANILAELHDFDLCVIGYVAVQPPAFTKPIYIFGRSGANISGHSIDKFNTNLEKHLDILRETPGKRELVETKLKEIEKNENGDSIKDQKSKRIRLEKEKGSISKAIGTIPSDIRSLYDFGPESSSEQVNTAVKEIQCFIALNKEKDMEAVYNNFMKLNAHDKKKFFVLLNNQAKDQITLRLLRDAYNEVCAEMRAENHDVHIWYVDDLSDESKAKIQQAKKENLDSLNDVEIRKLLLEGMEKQLDRICAEDKLSVELSKFRGVSEEHIISGGYYSVSHIKKADKLTLEKRTKAAIRYVIEDDSSITSVQPEINAFKDTALNQQSKVVVNHIESCKVCSYLAKNDHEAKAYDPKTIAISISPCRAKKEKIAPSSAEENELFNSLIAIVDKLPKEISQSLEDEIRFLFSARDLLGVEGELTKERIELISTFLHRVENFIKCNSCELPSEDLALFSKFVIVSRNYLRQMQDAVAPTSMSDKRPDASRLFSGSSFFSAASSSSSSSSLHDYSASGSSSASTFTGYINRT